MSAALWLKPPGGQWTPIGETGYPRIIPSTIHTEFDQWGPKTASFVVDLGPRLPIPALTPWARAILEIDGVRHFSGYVQNPVMTGRQVAVTLSGTQMDLDGPLINLLAADTRLSMWTDTLTTGVPWSVNTGNQIGVPIRLGWSSARSNVWTTFDDVQVEYNAVTYTRRPAQITALIVQLHIPKNVSNLRFGVHSTDQMGDYIDAPLSDFLVDGSAKRWGAQDISTAGDYTFYFASPVTPSQNILTMGIWLLSSGSPGNNGNVPQGTVCQIKNILAVDETAYLNSSTKVSTLLASEIAPRAAASVASLSADLSQIQTTSAVIPAFVEEDQTPRQVLTDAGAFDDVIAKIDAFDRPVFKPRSPAPSIEVGYRSPPTSETPIDPTTLIAGVSVSTPSTNPQAGIYPSFFSVMDLDPQGPSWVPVSGGPLIGGQIYAAGPFGGGNWGAFTFEYSHWMYPVVGGPSISALIGDLDNWSQTVQPLSVSSIQSFTFSGSTFPQFWCSFMPTQDWAAPGIDNGDNPSANTSEPFPIPGTDPRSSAFGPYFLYTLTGLFAGVSALGSLSLPADMSATNLVAPALTYLQAENSFGFTQTRAVGDGYARDAQTGLSLPASALGAHTNEVCRFNDRLDPADGKQGALATISGVIYDHDPRQAQITVGQRYGDVDETIARLTARALRSA